MGKVVMCKIVGAFYRPPAKGLLNALEPGDPLAIWREPGNEYDPNAIAVMVDVIQLRDHEVKELSWEQRLRNIESEVGAQGFELKEILEKVRWHLGYVPREIAKDLKGVKLPAEGEFTLLRTGDQGIKFSV